MKTIDSFFGEYFFLSNFFPSSVLYEGILYPTSEHAYQAAKTLDKEKRQFIAQLKTPTEAKQQGKVVKQRDNWYSIKLGIMEDVVRIKFTTHENLAQRLLATDDAVLIEGNHWHDTYWGVCNGKGRNELGKILMKIRTEINCGIKY